MKTIKISRILFSLAVIGALVLAAVPAAPVFALSTSAANTISAEKQLNAPAPNAGPISSGTLVCRSVVRWHNGHRIVIRVCHRVANPE
jgi:hypothetical protein